MSFVTILYILVVSGAIQGIFILIALRKIRAKNERANRLLFYLILSISIILICRLSYGPLFFWQPKLAMLPDIIVFFFGPLIFLYSRALLFEGFRFERRHWLHFLPVAVHFLILLRSFFIPNEAYIELYQAGAFYLRNYIILGTALIHGMVYLALTFRTLTVFRKEESLSHSQHQRLNYLRAILFLMALCLIIWLGSYVYAVVTARPSLDFHTYNFLWIALSFVTYLLGYYAISQPEIFKVSPKKAKDKYQSSNVSTEELTKLKERLVLLMNQEKPYLKPGLTIKELAEAMDSNTHIISRLINESFQTSFFDFINSYRVEEFIQKAREERAKRTFLALAQEVGFNNKTSFNQAFKKHKGTTPREFFRQAAK